MKVVEVAFPKGFKQELVELTLDSASAVKGLIVRAYDAKNNSATAAAK